MRLVLFTIERAAFPDLYRASAAQPVIGDFAGSVNSIAWITCGGKTFVYVQRRARGKLSLINTLLIIFSNHFALAPSA